MSSTGFVNGSTLTDAGWFNDADTVTYAALTSPSGTNTITATGPVSMTAYAARQRFFFIPANTNTGATTLNITPSGASALGAKNIFWNGAACVGGEIVANVPCEVFYDGTQFHLLTQGTSKLKGTTTNDSAPSGFIGEVQTSTVVVGSAVSLTTAGSATAGKTITSISLTAGDWDVWGSVGINMAATTNFTAIAGGINTVTDTLQTAYEERTQFIYGAAGVVPNNPIVFPFPTARISISATTTYYLIGYAQFTISTATAFGRITARRVR